VLDHVALEVADLTRAARFYDAVMGPLGGRRIVDSPDGIGYGRDRAELWIMPRRATHAAGPHGSHMPVRRRAAGHVALAAYGRRAVDAAHRAGLSAGGHDGGAPAAGAAGPPLRYSGYLVDPDGAWVELVSGARQPHVPPDSRDRRAAPPRAR
jgi:catechol 2,3-dioxygenase-like lactoylglutathione lyase family enzyme